VGVGSDMRVRFLLIGGRLTKHLMLATRNGFLSGRESHVVLIGSARSCAWTW